MKRMFWFLVLPALAFAGTVQLAGVANADFTDEFSVPQLDPGWQIMNSDTTHWSLTARPGFLRIMTQYFDGNNMTNWFGHLEAISGNFEVSVKLIARPDSAGQLGAIFAYYDTTLSGPPQAMVGYGNAYSYKGVFGIVNDTTWTSLPYSDTLVYLRIRTSGDTAFAEFSPDNSTWTVLKSGYPFPLHQVSGLMAMNYSGNGGNLQTPAMNADYDWFHLVARTGVEEGNKGFEGSRVRGFKITPNPFTSFVRVPGHEAERFALYDVSGRKVGTYQGSRIGEGLAGGVYFLQLEGKDAKPLRIVKVR